MLVFLAAPALAILLWFLVLLCVAHAECFGGAELPLDVQAFVERRNACEHWRGEVKEKYKGNAAVSGALAGFDPKSAGLSPCKKMGPIS